MNLFELERLRQEGKQINLPGGISAELYIQERMFTKAEERINAHWARVKLEDLQDLEDENGDFPPRLLGC